MKNLSRAIDLLEQGKWEEAHVIVQADDSSMASWIHGVVHLLEGDPSNARYWYRRAGRPFPDPPSIENEIAALRCRLEET